MNFYGFVENHAGYLIWVYEYLLGVRNPLNFPSCVYVWVMNHLGVVVGDAFGLFWGFLVRFLEKGTNSANLGNFGVLRCGIGIPCSSVSPR